jgi:hypothetical protein
VYAVSSFQWHFNLWSISGAGQVLFGHKRRQARSLAMENAPMQKSFYDDDSCFRNRSMSGSIRAAENSAALIYTMIT